MNRNKLKDIGHIAKRVVFKGPLYAVMGAAVHMRQEFRTNRRSGRGFIRSAVRSPRNVTDSIVGVGVMGMMMPGAVWR